MYTQASCLGLCSEDFSVYSAVNSALYILFHLAHPPPQVVKMKGTEKVYALKILNKWEMLKRHQVSTSPIPTPHLAPAPFPLHV